MCAYSVAARRGKIRGVQVYSAAKAAFVGAALFLSGAIVGTMKDNLNHNQPEKGLHFYFDGERDMSISELAFAESENMLSMELSDPSLDQLKKKLAKLSMRKGEIIKQIETTKTKLENEMLIIRVLQEQSGYSQELLSSQEEKRFLSSKLLRLTIELKEIQPKIETTRDEFIELLKNSARNPHFIEITSP